MSKAFENLVRDGVLSEETLSRKSLGDLVVNLWGSRPWVMEELLSGTTLTDSFLNYKNPTGKLGWGNLGKHMLDISFLEGSRYFLILY